MSIIDYLRTSSIDIEGSLNFRRHVERSRYNRWLLGTALRSELGHEQISGESVYSVPPSWTQSRVGLSHAFVLSELSSSRHEVTSRNAFFSGTQYSETTAVPASSTLYYDKSNRYINQIYKLSASANTPGNSNPYSSFDSVSGSYFRLGIDLFDPADDSLIVEHSSASFKTFVISVPDYGRISNIRVWVEYVRPVHSGSGGNIGQLFLGNTFIGLRSPNVRFGSGLPARNDRRFKTDHFGVPQLTGGLKHCFRGTYVLWDGAFFVDSDQQAAGHAVWDTDYNMRTIFSDGAGVLNPRHLDPMWVSGSDSFDPYVLGYNSPSFGLLNTPFKRGNYVSWISDQRIVTSSAGGAAVGSPPSGWLTGPANTAADNEFPTTGSNWGPKEMKPVYPLLDDVIEIRPTRTGSSRSETEYVGFRPGLRGTEIHGDWELVFAQNENYGVAFAEYHAFFRQFRLEITYEKRQPVKFNRFLRKTNASLRSPIKRRLLHRLSASFYRGTVKIYPDEGSFPLIHHLYDSNGLNYYGTSVGITDSTASNLQDFAVFARITGSILSSLPSASVSNMQNSFIRNEFGTPFVPLSSGSGENPSFFVFDDEDSSASRALLNDVLRPRTIIKQSQILKSALNRTIFIRSARDRVLSRLSNISIFGSSSGSTIPV